MANILCLTRCGVGLTLAPEYEVDMTTHNGVMEQVMMSLLKWGTITYLCMGNFRLPPACLHVVYLPTAITVYPRLIRI